MSLRGSALAKRRIRLGAHVWWDAVTSGAFFSRTSLLLSLLIAMTVMAPFQHFDSSDDYLSVLLVGFLGWALLAIALLPAAFAERRLRDRRARVLVVLGAIVAASVARPFLNELLFAVFYGMPPILDDWAARVTSNIVFWVAGLSVIAMTVRSIELTRGTRGRLNAAVATLTRGRQRLARFENDNRVALDELIGELRIKREALLAGTIDFPAVRAYSEVVRSASHRLEERANLNLNLIDAKQPPTPEPIGESSALAMLRPPPVGMVGVVFLAGGLPYTNGVGGLQTAVTALLVALPLTLAADLVTRLLARRQPPTVRGSVIVATWTVAGILMTVLAHLLVDAEDPSKLVPLFSMPLLAIALAACTDAIARAAISSRRLEAVLGLVARTLTSKTAEARRPLRNAAHVLHGRVQGRCVMLAAYADEWELTDAEIDGFRSDTDAAFDSVLWFEAEADSLGREGLVQSNHEDVAELVATWGGVLDVSSEISEEAADVLIDPALSHRVATVVNEGFVNAVKHSEAKAVWLSIDREGSALLVRTWSIGVIERAPVVEPSSRGVSLLGEGARIFQRGDEVVLEVPVPLAAEPTFSAPAIPRSSGMFRKASPRA
ncbi:hypothetical protein [Microbacterium dauci]|uniref:Signal transduction histidine kinase n=1 Tax=Microbacterium dauci TaxID=3048008 RepID=A0ABT6ZEB6_9MICO|nr:hypothetical protein [Microbacterium sp. LX3-4]MDJ1114507.1 hypothetical protein [Microbacterium sp. LX3-4]